MILTCKPIGIIHTDKKVKFDTPHQPLNGTSERNIIELYPDQGFEIALRDLDGFSRIWLIWWFEKNKSWRPLVSPPRGSGRKRGVFATRSPHRPCPIGMTAVPLISISKRELVVGNVDLLDGTPILDIKPYISEIDSYQNQKHGWLDEEEEEINRPAVFTVSNSNLAEQQIAWLKKEWNIDFITKAVHILERNPFKSRSNRVTAPVNGISRLGSGAWRVYFRITDREIEIVSVGPGYPIELLSKEGFEVIPDWEAQLAFWEVWQG